jgi:hypothetical protein
VHSARILLHLTEYGKAHITFYTNPRGRSVHSRLDHRMTMPNLRAASKKTARIKRNALIRRWRRHRLPSVANHTPLAGINQ